MGQSSARHPDPPPPGPRSGAQPCADAASGGPIHTPSVLDVAKLLPKVTVRLTGAVAMRNRRAVLVACLATLVHTAAAQPPSGLGPGGAATPPRSCPGWRAAPT